MAQKYLTSLPAFYDPHFPSTENLDADQREIVARFNAEIAADTMNLEAVPCLCGSKSSVILADYDRYRIKQTTVLCTECGLIRSDPRMTAIATEKFYQSDTYRKLYDPNLMGIDEEQFKRGVQKSHYRYDFVTQHVDLKGVESVLEVGCGAGWNLWPYFQNGKTVTGFDYGPTLVAFGASKGMNLKTGSVEDISDGSYDLIVLSHVLEHFLDPVASLAHLVEKMTEKSAIYIEVPNADHFCIGALQNAHTYLFSPFTLRQVTSKVGLKQIASQEFGSHLGVVLVMGKETLPAGKDEEFARIRGIIKRHERRQKLKRFIAAIGLDRVVSMMRGGGA